MSIEFGDPGTRFVTDLFVDPARQERGAGGALLEAALAGAAATMTNASLPDARGFVVRLDGAVAAAGWAHGSRSGTGRTLTQLLIAPDADPVAATIAAWHAAAPDGGIVASHVPGPHPATAFLLDRGIRITDRDQWCASDPDLLDPVRLLPNPSFL